jgi:hypothetical protein
MRANAARHALAEPGIEGRCLIVVHGAPEMLVSLGGEDGQNACLRGFQIGDLYQQVD